MERGNTKHGRVHDEEMAHEIEGMVRGGAKRAHGEDWREPEPVGDELGRIRRGDGANPRPSGPDYELRSELARVLTRDWFPADRDRMLSRLADAGAPEDLTGRVAALPGDESYDSPRDVLVALGINSPETKDQPNTGRPLGENRAGHGSAQGEEPTS